MGSGDLFQVNSSGAIAALTGITTSGGYTQTGTTANTFTGTPTFSNATYSALFTGGNVGIGTSAPAGKLEVFTDSPTIGNFPVIIRNNTFSSPGPYDVGIKLKLSPDSTGFHLNNAWGAMSAVSEYPFSDKIGLAFYTVVDKDVGAPTEKLRISGEGNVGVGTSSPYRSLSVGNNAVFGADVLASYFTATTSTASTFPYASTTALTVSGNAYFPGSGIWNSSGNVGIGTTSPSAKLSITGSGASAGRVFAIANSSNVEKITVLDNGNVGVNNTSPIFSLEVGVTGNVYAFAVRDAKIGAWTEMSRGGFQTRGMNMTLNAKEGDLDIQTAGTRRMTVENAGNVGIGSEADPVSLLANTRVNITDSYAGTGANTSAITWTTSDAGYATAIQNSSSGATANGLLVKVTGTAVTNRILTLNANGTDIFAVQGNGNVGIGTTTPWRTLAVSGTVAMNGLTSSATGNALCITTGKEITDAGGGTCTPSSIRFKENVVTLSPGYALNELSKLNVVSFDYKQKQEFETNRSYGLIAEDVELIDNNLVDYGYDGKPFSLHFEKITGLLVQAVQEQQTQINAFGSTTLASTVQTTSSLSSAIDLTNSNVLSISNNLNILTATTTALFDRINIIDSKISDLLSSTTMMIDIASSTVSAYTESTPFLEKIFASFMNFLSGSVASIKGVLVGELRIEEKLCVDDVCIDKNQLKALLIQAGATTPTPSPSSSPTPTPTSSVVPESSTSPEPSTTPTPEITPTPSVTSDPSTTISPEPTPTVTPTPSVSPEPTTSPEAPVEPAPAPSEPAAPIES